MKRLLLIAALCLASAPVEASTFVVQDGQYIVLGDFSNYVGSDINGHIIEYNISATPFLWHRIRSYQRAIFQLSGKRPCQFYC